MHVLCCQMSLGRDVLKVRSQTSENRHFTGTRIRIIIARNIEYSMLFYRVLRDWQQDKIYRLQSEIPIQLSLLGGFFYTNKQPATALSHIYQLYLIVWALPLCVN